jgi:hypothetical protein
MAFVPIADRARSGSPNGASGRVHRQLRQPCRHSPVRGVEPEGRASAPRGLSCRQRQTRVPGDRLHEPSPSERYFLYYRDAEWTVRASQPGCLNASSWIPPRATRYLEALATYLTPSAHNYRLRQCCRESRRAVLEAYWSLLRKRWEPVLRHRRLLAAADYLLLGVTTIGRLTRGLVHRVASARFHAKFANRNRS